MPPFPHPQMKNSSTSHTAMPGKQKALYERLLLLRLFQKTSKGHHVSRPIVC